MADADDATTRASVARGVDVVPLREATRAWFGVSLQTFGGPAGQIAVMQRALVDDRRWIGQRRFLHALSFCMLLPGPEAQQLAVYTGWLLNGARGGLIAGVLFVLPGMLAMLGLTALTLAAGDTVLVAGLFAGLAPAVIAIVVHALHRVGRRALTHPALVAVAVVSFLALTLFAVPFPVVVLAAGVAGWLLSRAIPDLGTVRVHGTAEGPEPLIGDDALHDVRPSLLRTLRALVLGVAAWFAPVLLAALLFGPQSVYVDESLFFAGAAVVTFGGAYAVLAYVAQQAVEVHHWLTPGEMVHGLALAETTPGPLIMVTQWVGGLGAFRDPDPLAPWVGMVVGSLLTTWVTFVPSFLFIFLGAPYVERLRHDARLTAALTGITAAVVGVIANLALYFALHTLFSDTASVSAGPVRLELPAPASWNPLALGITALALVLLFGLRWSTLRVLGLCAAAGLLGTLLLPS